MDNDIVLLLQSILVVHVRYTLIFGRSSFIIKRAR